MTKENANPTIGRLRDRGPEAAGKFSVVDRDGTSHACRNDGREEPCQGDGPVDVFCQINPHARAGGDRVVTIDELSRRLNVSSKTISRWRRRGLDGHEFVCGGHRRVGFLESEVERFVREHPDRIRRAAQFSQLTDSQRQGIVAEARRLSETGQPPSDVIRRLAQQTSRSVETIRYTLRQHDHEHPRTPLLVATPALGERARQECYHRYRLGEPVEALSNRYRCSQAVISCIVAEMRLRHIEELPLEFVPWEGFEHVDPREEQAILGPPPRGGETARKTKAPSNLPPYLASLYEVPLLTREQEAHLFRKMNYLKHEASRLRESIDPLHPSMTRMDRVEQLYQQSVMVKNEIMRANLRLVVSIAKRYTRREQSLFDLVSDGNMSLIRALEKFDFSRGFKFSTYATWAIVKNFARTLPNEQRHRTRFRTSREELLDLAGDERNGALEEEAARREREGQIAKMLGYLDDREREIVRWRFGLDQNQDPMTLHEIGAALGVTKERVRQIETRALAKLRSAARHERIEEPDEF